LKGRQFAGPHTLGRTNVIVHSLDAAADDAAADARAAVVLAALAQDEAAVGEICGALRLACAFMAHAIEKYPDHAAMPAADCEIVMGATGFGPSCFDGLSRLAADMAMRTTE